MDAAPPSLGPVFSSSRIINYGDLSAEEQEAFVRFFAENHVQFFRDSDGSYAANIRLYDADLIDPTGSSAKKGKDGKAKSGADAGRLLGGSTASASALFDFSVYPSFTSLVSGRESVRPKARPLAWLMRLIEEVYDARYARDTAELRGEGEEEGGNGSSGSSSSPFPTFVVEFFTKRYGLRSLIDQTCWDLLYNTHTLRKEHLEVEIFARFLEDYYDADDLLFFLYVRAVVQREMGVSFRGRWSDLARPATAAAGAEPSPKGTAGSAPSPAGGAPAPLHLSFKECTQVSRVVFGSESDPLFRTFLALVERNMSGAKAPAARGGRPGTAGVDSRRIEVTQFLHLALVEYHETRPTGDEEGNEGSGSGAAAAADASADASAGLTASQQRLIREAEAQFVDRSLGASAASSAAAGAGAGSSPAPPKAPFSTAAPAAVPRPSKALLEALGEAMHNGIEATLDRLLEPAGPVAHLPSGVRAQIRSEVQAQLESKVDGVLETVIAASQAGGAAATGKPELDQLAGAFRSVLVSGSAAGVESFAAAVLGCDEVRTAIEPLVELLVSYASGRVQG